MTIKNLAKLLTSKEGLKKQVSIADMTEILGHLSDLVFEENDRQTGVYDALLVNGYKRAKKSTSRLSRK